MRSWLHSKTAYRTTSPTAPHFVVGAQRFTEPMERTVQYLNAMHRRSRYCLIEVVRFIGENDEEVFEARTVCAPEPISSRDVSRRDAQLTREALLEQLGESPFAVPSHRSLIVPRRMVSTSVGHERTVGPHARGEQGTIGQRRVVLSAASCGLARLKQSRVRSRSFLTRIRGHEKGAK